MRIPWLVLVLFLPAVWTQKAGGDYFEGIVREQKDKHLEVEVFGEKLTLYAGAQTGETFTPGEKVAIEAEQGNDGWEVRSAAPVTSPAIHQTIEGRLKNYHQRSIELEVAGRTLKAKTDWLPQNSQIESAERVRVTAAPIFEFGKAPDLDPLIPKYPKDWRAIAIEPLPANREKPL